MMALSAEEATIWSKLELGADNGKTSHILTQEMGFNRRKICDAVEGLRSKGYPVGALRRNRTGYFRIANKSEKQETVIQIRRQAYRELELADRLEKAEVGE